MDGANLGMHAAGDIMTVIGRQFVRIQTTVWFIAGGAITSFPDYLAVLTITDPHRAFWQVLSTAILRACSIHLAA